MNNIIKTSKPKEAIAFYNKKYLVPFLASHQFVFKENILEYHRSKPGLKQVIWHRCSKNNIAGEIIDFEVGYYNLSSGFKTWYKKKYGENPIGGSIVIGNKNPYTEKWNGKYNPYIGRFGYDLINKDIEDQFAVILENVQQVMIPYFDFFSDFDTIIDNTNLISQNGEFDVFAHIRQIEHCLFLKKDEKAKQLAEALMNYRELPESYQAYRDTELARIFKAL